MHLDDKYTLEYKSNLRVIGDTIILTTEIYFFGAKWRHSFFILFDR